MPPHIKNFQLRDGEGPSSNSFPVVGIGASAGGLEAFTQLVSTLPDNTGMAFLLVQHLDPKHESRLTDLLAKASSMQVWEAVHDMTVRPNHVYVIPPNANMGIAQGRLQVTPRGEGRAPHFTVDYLFRSLAQDQQARAIGVVLSGTGSDGTLGVREIKAVAGITFAQDEKTAKHSGMPHSAVESGAVDFVLSPKEIARRLAQIGRHPYLTPDAAAALPSIADDQYQKVLAVVRAASGVDFSQYRDTTIRRRIMRRLVLHGQQSLDGYVQRLKEDQAEVEALYRDLLINVTSFFRDAEMFETLKAKVFPEIVKNKNPLMPVRIWAPGCSTGQEAYSIAMALWEFFDDKPVRPPIQIFATDLGDPSALDKARAGVYPENIEAEVSAERLRRFFTREGHVYRIAKPIRDTCVFARQNITVDPPFSHVDLISCRNVLIYLSPALQKRVLPIFHYALNPAGFLVLGSAETTGDHADFFEIVDRTQKIYAKKPAIHRPPTHWAAADYKSERLEIPPRAGPVNSAAADFQREADRLTLNRYTPPGVLVNEHFDVLQFRGRTSRYLESPPGEPTSNLLKMVREGLFVEMRSALMEAKARGETVRREGIRLRHANGVREINFEILPLKPFATRERCFLILFEESHRDLHAEFSSAQIEKTRQPGLMKRLWHKVRGSAPLREAEKRILENERELGQLRQELTATKEYLQSLVEQQDAANEELRSANEEILSSNEELQSTNEELETAKEELQSTNEELTTVNEQLQNRNLELNQTTNDLTNLLVSTAIPVVMVGSDFRIHRVTPSARKVMNLLPTDVGRPISDIKGNVELPGLEQLITGAIDSGQVQEREVRQHDGHWYLLRVAPYWTADNRIDGAVILLLDIDPLKRSLEEISQQAEQLRRQASLLDLSRDAIMVCNEQDEIIFWNKGAEVLYGWPQAEARGKTTNALLHTVSTISAADLAAILERTGHWEGELRHTRRDGSAIVVDSQKVAVRDESGRRSATLKINRDISERKRAEETLKEADQRKDEFLATLAHELRNPLAPIRNALEIMRRPGETPGQTAYARDIIERQVQQMIRIVDDLLDITRITQGKVELRKEQIVLQAVVETALETLNPLLKANQHHLSVTLPQAPTYLYADPVRLAQVLINLLHNATKFTKEGGHIWLTVELSNNASKPAEEVIIRVRDDGKGISANLMPHIFEMFIQGAHSLERIPGGLGVGLMLVKTVVQLHGGSIKAHSAGPDLGSEFVVRMPIWKEQRGRQKEKAKKALSPALRILIADDNEDAAESLGTLLKIWGHEVNIVYDGPSILGAAMSFRPSAALIDIGLPGMNGYEVARQLRSQPDLKNVFLIALTGYGSDRDRLQSREAGFDLHLVKPVGIDSLQKALSENIKN